MPKLTKKAANEMAAKFNEEFKLKAEVAVVGDDGRRWVGVLTEAAKAIGTAAKGLKIEAGVLPEAVTTEGTEVAVSVPVARIRQRAIEKKRTSSPQRVALTTEERLESGDKIADAMSTISDRKADLKSVQKAVQSDVQDAESIVEKESERLRTGYEVRSVECSLTMDFDRGVAVEVRNDTGEEIKRRPLYPDEQAQELELFPHLYAGDEDAKKDEPKEPAKEPGKEEQGVTDEAKGTTQEPEKKPEPPQPIEVTEGHIETAIQILKETGRASVTSLQRRMKLGYEDVAQIMQALEERGVVGPSKANGEPRDIVKDLGELDSASSEE